MDKTDGNLDVLFINDNRIYLCHLPVVLLASNMLFFWGFNYKAWHE